MPVTVSKIDSGPGSGSAVGVGGSGVAVGGTGVAVGASGVAVGGTVVAVGGGLSVKVAVGTGVAVGVGVDPPQAARMIVNSEDKTRHVLRALRGIFRLLA
jgi:hypothetical protein